MTYRELQAALKEYGKRCQVKRNAKREALELELARLQATEATREEKIDSSYSINELRYEIARMVWPSKPEIKMTSKKAVLVSEFIRLRDIRNSNREYRQFMVEARALLKETGMAYNLIEEVLKEQADGTPEEKKAFLDALKDKLGIK